MIKQAKLLKEKYPDLEIYMHFMDVRTPGKDFDEYYTSALDMGINIIRGRVGGIDKLPGDKLRVMGFDADLASNIEIDADLVVMATAIELQDEIKPFAQKLSLTLDGSGFFKELHPKLKPVETAVEGIFLAGCCQGPKDIPDTVAQAKGAAAAAAVPLAQGKVKINPTISEIDMDKCSGCGICEPLCPYQAISMIASDASHPRARIEMTQCKGCGVCTTACPSSAINLHGYTEDQIMAQIFALTA
jgi:heterodisulfide reductase subunit A